MVYKARDIWNMDKEAVWKLPDGPMSIEFEDGVLDTTMRATVFSYYMGVFHRMYPKTPLLMRHHLGPAQISKSTHLDLLSLGMWDCIDTYGDGVDIEELAKVAYETTNEIYNDFTTILKSHVSTISILDFMEVMEHPEIKEANSNVQPTQLSIDQTYHKITEVLKRDGELKRNTVGRMAKSGLVSIGQIQQCVGPRGFLTDIDSVIFPYPILTGYVQGISKLYDSMIESRSAAKALIFAKDPVAESEYFNREMQLMSTTLTRLHPGDCGSKESIYMKVGSGDLKKLAGKFHRQSDGSEVEISVNDHHLIGKMVQLRSVLKCQHPDAYGVCAKCFGSLAYAVPRNTNIGHFSTTVLCEMISQNVLSTKHEDGSSKVDEFDVLSEYDKKFLRVGSFRGLRNGEPVEDDVLKLAECLSGRKVNLILAASQAENLNSIDYRDVDKLPLEYVSSLTEVAFQVERENGERVTATVPVSMGTRLSSLTYEALHFIKKNGWTLSDQGNYIVDLSKWENELPLFRLPKKHTDMVQYMKTIKSFIMGSRSVKKKTQQSFKTIQDYPTVERSLMAFYQLISSKLNVNIAHLEVILLATMVRNGEAPDHRLPRPITEGEIGAYSQNLEYRSLGAAMAYQGQARTLTDTKTFLINHRPDHPFDNLLCPYPVNNPNQ